ncbi:MAG: hypothetical protein ABEI52_08070 [Halobacteriaceae archaeon]
MGEDVYNHNHDLMDRIQQLLGIQQRYTDAAERSDIKTDLDTVDRERKDYENSREHRALVRAMNAGSQRFQSTMKIAAPLNEALNSNKYIKTSVNKEFHRVLILNQMAKEETSKLQQLTHHDDYVLNHRRFQTHGIVITFFSTALMGVLIGMWKDDNVGFPTPAFAVFATVLMLVYASVMLYIFLANSRRRKNLYNKSYWRPTLGDDYACR